MVYFKKIKEAHELVCNGDTSQASVQQALQYENWQRLPGKITKKVLNHPDCHLLDAESGEHPVWACPELAQNCQIQRSTKRISLAYSLCRLRGFDSQLDMIYADDLPQLWRVLERKRKRGKIWITTNRLTLQSERDLHDLVCRLGLYPWRFTSLHTPVFCLELHNMDCVKPNALDASLAFYFHQTPGQDPGSTRNLKTGKPDMEEWLCLEVNNDTVKCVGGCITRKKVKLINMDGYYKNNAQRIRR